MAGRSCWRGGYPALLRRLEQEVEGETSVLRTATILEVLRARPVIDMTGRAVMRPFQLGEWCLPPDARVLTQISTVHADDRFHPDASRFDPDRYVEGKPAGYAWIPFGGGVRRCIGAAFAQFEMDVVIRTMLQHFELEPTDAPGERWSFRGVAFAPARGGLAVVQRRDEPLGKTAGQSDAAACCPVDHGAHSRTGSVR